MSQYPDTVITACLLQQCLKSDGQLLPLQLDLFHLTDEFALEGPVPGELA